MDKTTTEQHIIGDKSDEEAIFPHRIIHMYLFNYLNGLCTAESARNETAFWAAASRPTEGVGRSACAEGTLCTCQGRIGPCDSKSILIR